MGARERRYPIPLHGRRHTVDVTSTRHYTARSRSLSAPMTRSRSQSRFARFAWSLLLYDVGVATWGAYVRATGSGAGCGRHWPLCNGEVLPRAPRVETLVELSHRVSSGAALVLTAVLLVWAWREYPRGHRVFRAAALAATFMAAEAAIGAALVLFELVAHNASAKRALSVGLHLSNTFLLLGSTALTAWWASGGPPVRIRGQGAALWAMAAPIAGMFLVGVSGAVTALGDTLFPSPSVATGLARDLASDSSWFLRLRALHPLFAVGTAALIVTGASVIRSLRPSQTVARVSRVAAALAVAQVAAGMLDVTTLAPVWLQLLHLVLAYAVWLSLLLTAAAGLRSDPLPPLWPAQRGLPMRPGERADAA